MRHRVIRGRNPYLGLDWSHGRHLGAAILACDVIYAKGAPILLMSRKNTVNSKLIIYFISHFPKIRNSYGNRRCFEYIGSNQIQF